MADDRERADLVDELEGTRRQLESLLSGRIVARSEIVLLQSRENQLLERIAGFDRTFVRKHIALAKTDWEDAVNREQTLKERYEAELANAQSLLGLVSEYAILTSECDILERQCSSLSEQISKVPQDATREGLSIYVLERAVRAEAPLSQEARILGVGLVLGLMVGCGLAFLRDMRDERVRSADEIVAILGLPILGAVPTIPRKGLFFPRPRSWLSPDSRESESFRSIRTALFYGSSSGDAKTLLVTSPGPLDGKTTMVSNLGIAMAHAGQKTLIVDADLRKPIQHRIFSKDGHGKGLIDVLAGTVTVDEAIRATEIAGLDVLEGGRTIGNPSELLSSDALDAVIEQLKSRYDRILVDSPPIGIVADAQILAAKCASTLLVLRAERSSRIGTQCARDALSAVSAKVVGVVVNDVRKRDTRYSHYGSGAYGYYHGRYESGRPHVATRRLPGGADPRPGDGPTTSETGPQDVWSRTW